MNLTCEHCDQSFERPRNKYKFCSVSCVRLAKARHTGEKNCPTCHKVFTSSDNRKIYCSRSCAATHNNTVFPKRKILFKDAFCLQCNSQLKITNKKFCSHPCQRLYSHIEKVNLWLSGATKVASYKDGSLAAWAKKYLLEQARHSCTICGWNTPNPVLGKPILCIDHVDGIWTNNKFENVKVLCYNCHTLTPTFGALNIGASSGRRPGDGNRRNKDLLETI